ncbi:uncharacterized protein [Globicephala melas]|uniref:uncharacterized protein n=1 Tax=Globicephala melas TaxID=9731 RepID=UPI00293D3EDC|nr:uncharacterized protein LOC115851494 [Globicephala melas]
MEGTGKKRRELVPPKGMAVTLLYLSVVTQDLGPGAYIWMLCRNLDVTFRKDAFEQSSAHSVELEQGGKDSDLHQMKNKIHDVWPEEVVQEDYYQHQILADFEWESVHLQGSLKAKAKPGRGRQDEKPKIKPCLSRYLGMLLPPWQIWCLSSLRVMTLNCKLNLLKTKLRPEAQDTASQIPLRDCSEEVRRSQDTRSFYNKDQVFFNIRSLRMASLPFDFLKSLLPSNVLCTTWPVPFPRICFGGCIFPRGKEQRRLSFGSQVADSCGFSFQWSHNSRGTGRSREACRTAGCSRGSEEMTNP